jgi:Protein of unknown function (DUF3047)
LRKQTIAIIILVLFGTGAAGLFAQEGLFWVDKFSGKKSAEGIPEGWTLDVKTGDPDILLVEEKGSFWVHLRSQNSSFGLRKEFNLDIKDYPYLNWSWKVAKLPEKGNFLDKNQDDQAAQLYVLFPRWPAKINTNVVGYLWESNPKNKGLEGESPAWSKSKVIVLQAGPEKLHQWVEEKRNVYEDYKKLFGKEPPKVGGLSIYINTQHTQGTAESFFDNIFFSKK